MKEGNIRIGDLGLATSLSSDEPVGTELYKPVEEVASFGWDVFSCGVVS